MSRSSPSACRLACGHGGETLEEEGISTAVVNARFVKPLDQNLIVEIAKRVRYVVTVEEGSKMGGFGSAVLEALSDGGVTHLTTKIVGVAGLVHRARAARLPAGTIWVDGGRHLSEREGAYRQDTGVFTRESSRWRHRSEAAAWG